MYDLVFKSNMTYTYPFSYASAPVPTMFCYTTEVFIVACAITHSE